MDKIKTGLIFYVHSSIDAVEECDATAVKLILCSRANKTTFFFECITNFMSQAFARYSTFVATLGSTLGYYGNNSVAACPEFFSGSHSCAIYLYAANKTLYV